MNKKPQKNNKNTDWGNEIAHSLRLVGKIFLKLCSYVLNVLLTLVLIGILTGLIVGGAFAIYIKNNIHPDLEGFEFLVTNQSTTTKIYYMDFTDREHRKGTPIELKDQSIFGAQNRTLASYDEIPSNLINAFIAVEDKRFLQHGGVDWIRTLSATFSWVFGGSDRFGASTITQQLIKNVTGDDDVSIQRKVQEILRALELEKTHDKSEIIELYLNTIYLSQHSWGVQAAAFTYFGKNVKDLTLVECAALAAIPQFPSRYDPYVYPEKNTKRRNSVLTLMYEQNLITKQEFDSAYDKELVLDMQRSVVTPNSTNSWYKDQVISDAVALLTEKLNISVELAYHMIYRSGLQIYTVMDPHVQEVLENVFLDESNFVQAGTLNQPQCAMAIMDPNTGDILGLVGGRGEKMANNIWNYATSKRPPGSSIKPLTVYSPALDRGLITYGSVFDDVPFNFGAATREGDYIRYSRPDGWPSNYPAGYQGLTTISEAIKRSVNTVAVRVLDKLSIEASFEFATSKMRLNLVDSRTLPSGKVVTDKDIAPLGLGQLSYGVSVVEMTAAYGVFDNNGVYNEPRTILKILDSNGKLIVDNDKIGVVVISEETASIMTKMLQNVASTGGTAQRVTLKDKINVAGKTGTTSEDNDRWFVGYTPYYVGGVWFGYPMPKSLTNFSINPCVLIWDIVMTKLHQDYINASIVNNEKIKEFTLANGVITKTYCKDSGKLASDACKLDPRGNRTDVGYFTYETAPTETCDVHIIVNYDNVTKGVAVSDNCPKTIQVALLNIPSRAFPYQISVADAQYVYRELPAGVKPSLEPNEPFFMTAIPANRFPGITAKGEAAQYNRCCSEHYSEKSPVTEPETDPLEIKPPETAAPETQPSVNEKPKPEISKPEISIPETQKPDETEETTTESPSGEEIPAPDISE